MIRLCRDVKDYRGITKIGLAVRHATAKPGVRNRAVRNRGHPRAETGPNRGHPRVFEIGEIGDTHVSLSRDGRNRGHPRVFVDGALELGKRGHPRLFRETGGKPGTPTSFCR